MRTLSFNRIIGAGAMGTVYHAELRAGQGFTRQCAVKVIRSSSPDLEHFRTRMRDEARLLGMLQDEQILGVSELAQASGRDLVIMEYVEGVDLGDILSGGPVPPRALAEIGAEVAGTLHRAHRATHPTTGQPLRVIHRDVKPGNLMVTSRGGIRLLDFGVARAAFASRESHTQGLVLGTLNYFPPEILAGGDPTPSVDLYGLGLTLWECAAGAEWGSPQVQRERFERRVRQRLKELDSSYRELVPVIEMLLAWEPSERPSGEVVERRLLEIAERMPGQGLRTWARQVIPPVLEKRDVDGPTDDLVGQTLLLHDAPVEAGPVQLTPLDPGSMPAMPERPNPATMTYNDLAPPAAVNRPPESAKKKATPAAAPKASPPAKASTPVTVKKKRSPIVVFLAAGSLGVVLGGIVLLVLLLVLGIGLYFAS